MPLADYLANNMGGAVGGVARLFGGQSDAEKFINNELPGLIDNVRKATEDGDIRKAAGELLNRATMNGAGPKTLEKLSVGIIAPALENASQAARDSIYRDYGPQTTPITPQVAPEGQGQPLPADTTFSPQNTPARSPLADEEGRQRILKAFGTTPQALNMLYGQIPAEQARAAQEGAAQRRTEQQIQADQRKEEAIKALPPEQQPMARIAPAGLVQFQPQRADPLDEVRKKLIEQQTKTSAAAATEHGAAAAAHGRNRGSAMFQDYLNMGGDPNDEAKFLEFADRYRGAGKTGGESTTTTEQPLSGTDTEIYLKRIAEDAINLGKTKPDDIKAIAARRGLEIEGTPELSGSNWKIGQAFSGPPTLTGEFTIKRKPKVVTKQPGTQPGQGRYSQGVPTGSGSGANNNDPLEIRPKK